LIPKTLPKMIGLVILAVLITALAPGYVLARSPAAGDLNVNHSPTATTVSVTPSSPSVSDCEILEVYIDVNAVSDLYAVDVRLSFDPAVLEVVDFNLGSSVVDLEPIIDPNLNFTAGYTIRNQVNNFTGTIWYAATQTSPTPAASGSGHVARIRLRAKSTAISPFNFTYIKLSNANGVQIPATAVNTTVSASTGVVPSLSITRLNASQVQLSWPAIATGVNNFHLYRSSLPYFYATDPAYQVIANPASGTVTFDDSVLGNVTTNYFYTVRSECAPGGGKSATSTQVGKFEYEIHETTGTDYSWIGLVLDVPGISDTQNLANHIQNNSNGSVSVRSVSRWNASGQNTSSYNHLSGFGKFPVALKNPYRVEIDLPGLSLGNVIWAQVGELPAITTDTYTIYETSGTDYTWILQPLDMTLVGSTSMLASEIQNKSSAPVSVLTISRWNLSGQNYSSYNNLSGFGSFITRFGYPYRVEVNINSGFTVTWP
jgi:hypothetical protein